ncbi:MAG: tRNA (adenine-N(6)-)-methyltransferase [Bacteroidetes bacterium]|nr:MAG: tRNA (adenine-N(6)-)-methyltransferase [Bacteroidota bacterium]
MSSSIFRFKQFNVIQQNTAMKIGTDGVLLGAWADYSDPKSILDIGTGTGLIALMLSQRFDKSKVTAVEIDEVAAEEAKLNFKNSAWKDCLSILNMDFFEMDSTVKYDMLVCNPPYFKSDQRSPDKKRALARNGIFSAPTFLSKANSLMHNKSQISFILPFDQLDSYDEEAQMLGLKRSKTLFVKPTNQKPPNRVLVNFVNSETELPVNDNYLIIEEGERHNYSEGYKKLTSDFYLKF